MVCWLTSEVTSYARIQFYVVYLSDQVDKTALILPVALCCKHLALWAASYSATGCLLVISDKIRTHQLWKHPSRNSQNTPYRRHCITDSSLGHRETRICILFSTSIQTPQLSWLYSCACVLPLIYSRIPISWTFRGNKNWFNKLEEYYLREVKTGSRNWEFQETRGFEKSSSTEKCRPFN